MVGRGRPGHVGKIVIADSELSRISKVVGNVVFQKLLLDRSRGALQPGSVTMIGIFLGRIRRMRHASTLGPGKCAEVIVESMVLFENKDDMLNRARHQE